MTAPSTSGMKEKARGLKKTQQFHMHFISGQHEDRLGKCTQN
jgi:hypothetical protein